MTQARSLESSGKLVKSIFAERQRTDQRSRGEGVVGAEEADQQIHAIWEG